MKHSFVAVVQDFERAAMLKVSGVRDPVVLSYLALRKAVGYVALCLPFVLTITWWFVHDNHTLQTSISAYYYTGMRNLFVGSSCAISMSMPGCQGCDRHDEIAGIFFACFLTFVHRFFAAFTIAALPAADKTRFLTPATSRSAEPPDAFAARLY